MFRRMVTLGLFATVVTACAANSSPPPSNPQGPIASRSGHLPINGLKLYYEVYGELGKSKTAPLLLIPGAFLSTDSMKPWVAAFAAKRSVIVFDQQGHGRTADTSRKMSYEQFGDDAAALLRALKVERADVMGYSQGGGVALQLALRHPTLVNKLVSLSATYRKDGWYPTVFKAIEGLNAKVFVGSPVEGAFKKHTPSCWAREAGERRASAHRLRRATRRRAPRRTSTPGAGTWRSSRTTSSTRSGSAPMGRGSPCSAPRPARTWVCLMTKRGSSG
jgi:pimeloyl-ACP methyl ester carboxylesterase